MSFSGNDDMSSRSFYDTVSHGNSSDDSSSKDSEETPTDAVVRRDIVHNLRMGVLSVLLAVAAISVYAAYGTARKLEENSFRKAFQAEAFKVHVALHRKEIQQIEVMKALTNQITSYAMTSGSDWPNVTLPDVGEIFSTFQHIGKFSAIFFSPIIEPQYYDEWRAFCRRNLAWLPETLGEIHTSTSICETELSQKKPMERSWLPFWQYTPASNFPNGPPFHHLHYSLNMTLVSGTTTYPDHMSPGSSFMNDVLSLDRSYEAGEPVSIFTSPVFASLAEDAEVSAVVVAPFVVRKYLENILPESVKGLVCVLTNSMNESLTFEINGSTVRYLGPGDHHNPTYTLYSYHRLVFDENRNHGGEHSFGDYSITLYPSIMFEAQHKTKTPLMNAIFMFALFSFTTLVFLIYDCCVERRQRKITTKVNTATAVVSSLFPEAVGQQLIREAGKKMNRSEHGLEESTHESSDPIADFFPDVTIMFSDIKGFTAWSSSREPVQVFSLLGAIFGAFDEIARRKGVFKVETVGDQYVAVAGIPKPMASHAVVMTRFARECLIKMSEVIHSLEVSLGPETTELSMRFGLHSGCVTAGVLRGDKARFQLFGDAMNVASRMESTGEPGRIQVSEATAKLLRQAGKEDWLTTRKDMVHAKGKGNLQTFWVEKSGAKSGTTGSSSDHSTKGVEIEHPTKSWSANERLVVWNCALLTKVLKKIEKKRKLLGTRAVAVDKKIEFLVGQDDVHPVVEKVEMPLFDPAVNELLCGSIDVDLEIGVETQLHEFVTEIAELYNDNPFHDFAHASHVMMAVNKLMTRVVDSKDTFLTNTEQLHIGSYGITSDPLTQLACLLAALAHDADHPGVPNDIFKKEKPDLARKYKEQSIAEKISLDHMWSVLMQDKYSELRQAMYCNEEEFLRFRQLLVNSLLATDIQDTKLRELNYTRWEKAFNTDAQMSLSNQEVMNQRAAVVVQYLLQASDVSHTMQHWHVYRKWNERLFFEMRKAFDAGRTERDPALSWFEGEIVFFDHWIIPLAVRLKDCGAFGVASTECLDYATQNRNEWVKKGREEIERMVSRYEEWKKSYTEEDHFAI